MKIPYCLARLVFLSILISGCGDTPQLPKLSQDAVILAFGDSLTHGNGVQEQNSYPAILKKLTGREVINAGVSGEVSQAGLRRLPPLLERYHPQLLILCHGGNDILRKMDLNQMAANVKAMIRLAQEKNIPVVLLGVPRFGLFPSSAEQYKEIAKTTGVVFIEDLVPEILGDNSLKSDTVHPNKDGYRVMAETIYHVMQKAGAI